VPPIDGGGQTETDRARGQAEEAYELGRRPPNNPHNPLEGKRGET